MKSQSTLRGMGLALCATLFYGQVPVLARLAFLHGVDGIAVVLARTAFIACVLAPMAFAARGDLAVLRARPGALALQGLATLAVSTGIILSVQFIPASLAVMIFFSAPLIVLLAAPVVEGTRLTPARLAIGALGFSGLAIALGPSFQSLDPRGLGLAAMAACGYALQFFSGRRLAEGLRPLPLAWAVHAVILPPVLLFYGLMGKAAQTPLDATGLAGLFAVCAVYVLGYSLHMASLRQADASKVVMFFNFEPVVTMATATLLLGEQLTAAQVTGFAIVLSALLLSGWAAGKHPALQPTA